MYSGNKVGDGGGDPPLPCDHGMGLAVQGCCRIPSGILKESRSNLGFRHPARCWTRPWPELKGGGGQIGPLCTPPPSPDLFLEKYF